MLEGGLLETQKALKFYNTSLQKKVFLCMMIDLIMGQFPLLSKDLVVLQDHLLNLVGSGQDLLSVFLSVCLNPSDLGAMGSPLNFHVVYLWEGIS